MSANTGWILMEISWVSKKTLSILKNALDLMLHLGVNVYTNCRHIAEFSSNIICIIGLGIV